MTNYTFKKITFSAIADDLTEAYDIAMIAAGGDARWQNAIKSGMNDLLEDGVIWYDASCWTIRIESASTAGKWYEANGACQCEAYADGNPCRHRAAARLVRRALERKAAREAAQASAAEKAAKLAKARAEMAELFN